MQHTTSTNHWLISELGSSQYLINASQIIEIVPQVDLKVVEIAGSSNTMLGIADYRGHALKVFGLRQALGLATLEEEIGASQKMMADREQDHVNWLMELELSVKEERSFRLATDPNQCAFGKWYNNIMSDEHAMRTFCAGDPLIRILLNDFDEPHKKIHGLAKQVTQLVTQKKADEALSLIDQTRHTTLSEMIALFDRVRRLLGESRRSVVVVIQVGKAMAGVLVDSVNMIIQVEAGQITPMEPNSNMPAIFSGILTKHPHLNGPTPVIDSHYLCGGACEPQIVAQGASDNASPAAA